MRNMTQKLVAVVTMALVAGGLCLSSLPILAQTPGGAKAQTVDSAKAPKATAGRKAKALPAGKVDLNTASAEQLATLPKIGPKMAQRIVDYRTAHKGFKTIEELRNVKGIGPKVLDGLRPHLSL
ncbi:MAG: ComEA family DNA-binding protein [Acidobacteriota bacterium]